MSLLARRRIGDDNAGSTWADRVGDGGQERVPIDRHVGVLGDEFADFGGDGVNQRDHERDERREESGEGSKHLSISFVLHSLSEGVRHVETETGAFFLGNREDIGQFVQTRFDRGTEFFVLV